MKRVVSILAIMFLLIQVPTFAQFESTKKQLQSISEAFIKVSEKVRPAVVNISTEAEVVNSINPFNDDIFRFFFGQPPIPQKQRVTALGSGFIISPDGYILTNYHVVKDAIKIKVTLLSGKEYKAKLVGYDSSIDVALLKINGKKLPYAELGDSDKIKIGQWVIAIGNPFGLNFSVTAGIISALGRKGITDSPLQQLIQTDAAINRGNSGGPLIDLNGKVIGINTAIVSNSGGFEGIGFAVPINMAKAIVPQLKKNGTVRRGYLGVSVQMLNDRLKKAFHYKGKNGVLISDVVPKSGAAKAGLKSGDIIVSVNGKVVKSPYDLSFAIKSHEPGDIVKLRVWRNGKYMILKAKLSSMQGEYVKQTDKIGLKVKSLTQDIRNQYKIPSDIHGVVVVDVIKGKFADRAGLQPGDVILQINRTKINTMDDYIKAISKANTKKGILFYIYRNGTKIYSYYGE